jgi:hypothetical protein
MKRSLIAFGVLMILCSVVVLTQAPTAGTKTDPILGTWKLNPEKSIPKPPPGLVSVRQYVLRPDGFLSSVLVTVSAQGNPTFNQATWKYDGKDYLQYTQATLPEFSAKGVKLNTNAYRAVDAYTTEIIQKDGSGKPLFTGKRTRVVSKDGKTLTDTLKGTDARGQAVNNVAVFDKVQ